MVGLGVVLNPYFFPVASFEERVTFGLGAVPCFAVGLLVGLSGHGFELADELRSHGCGTCGDLRGHGDFGSSSGGKFRQHRGNGCRALARKVGHPRLKGFDQLRRNLNRRVDG